MTPETVVTDPTTTTTIATGQAAVSAQKSAAGASKAASAALAEALEVQRNVAETRAELLEDIAVAAEELVTREEFDALRAEMRPIIDHCTRKDAELAKAPQVEEIDVVAGIESSSDNRDSGTDRSGEPESPASSEPVKRRTGLRHRR